MRRSLTCLLHYYSLLKHYWSIIKYFQNATSLVSCQASDVGLGSLLVSQFSVWEKQLDTDQRGVRTSWHRCLSPRLTKKRESATAAVPPPLSEVNSSFGQLCVEPFVARDSGKCSSTYVESIQYKPANVPVLVCCTVNKRDIQNYFCLEDIRSYLRYQNSLKIEFNLNISVSFSIKLYLYFQSHEIT